MKIILQKRIQEKNNVENIMTKKRNIDSLAIMADKTDTFRVSEQIAVPHGKPPIGTIVWSDIRIKIKILRQWKAV